jgi:hypothetical protein
MSDDKEALVLSLGLPSKSVTVRDCGIEELLEVIKRLYIFNSKKKF